MPARLSQEEKDRRNQVKVEKKIKKEEERCLIVQNKQEVAELKKKHKEIRKEERDLENERHRNCCYTLHWYTDEDEQRIQELPARYNVYGKEHTKLQIPHLQGYLEFGDAQYTLRQLKKMIGASAHIERRHETSGPKNAAGYCKKGTEETTNGS